MDLDKATKNLPAVAPSPLKCGNFVRAYNTDVVAKLGHTHFFDCTWSFHRGYRYNFAGEYPVLYLAADHTVASTEIGPRKLADVLGPLKAKPSPYIYVVVEVTANVLDLTDRVIRRRLGVTLEDLLVTTDNWDRDMKAGVRAATHHLGRLAVDDGRFDGILYPPFPWRRLLQKQGKRNLAVFMDPMSPAMARALHRGVALRVQDPHGVLPALGLKF